MICGAVLRVRGSMILELDAEASALFLGEANCGGYYGGTSSRRNPFKQCLTAPEDAMELGRSIKK